MKRAIDPISPEQERELYLEGIRLFNAQQFFEAHEIWEDAWRASSGTKREFYQGLIQCAVALEHYRRGNPRGVLNLFNSYRKHFSNVPGRFLGLDVNSFLKEMKISLGPVLDRYAPVAHREILPNLENLPRLDPDLNQLGES